LQIKTDDPSSPTTNVTLIGTGTPLPNLVVTDSVSPATDQIVNFGSIAADGAGGAIGTASVTLSNNGSGPLTVNQNGITVPPGRSPSPVSPTPRGLSTLRAVRRPSPRVVRKPGRSR